jgi:hypothetical protein
MSTSAISALFNFLKTHRLKIIVLLSRVVGKLRLRAEVRETQNKGVGCAILQSIALQPRIQTKPTVRNIENFKMN